MKRGRAPVKVEKKLVKKEIIPNSDLKLEKLEEKIKP